MTREWELTYEPVKRGKVLVGVHSDDEKDVDRGAQILEKLNPVKIDLHDGQGRTLSR